MGQPWAYKHEGISSILSSLASLLLILQRSKENCQSLQFSVINNQHTPCLYFVTGLITSILRMCVACRTECNSKPTYCRKKTCIIKILNYLLLLAGTNFGLCSTSHFLLSVLSFLPLLSACSLDF